MALTFDFTNNPEDGKPEIILKASSGSAAEKIILNNIMNRRYGKPHIVKEECKHANGMATLVKIAFGRKPKPESEEEPEENKT